MENTKPEWEGLNEPSKKLTKEEWVALQEQIKITNQLTRRTKHKAFIETGNVSLTNRV